MNHGILAQVVGNWTVTGIWSKLSGDQVTPALSTAVSNSAGGGPERPNRVRDGNLPADQRLIDHWFDPLAFVPQARSPSATQGAEFWKDRRNLMWTWASIGIFLLASATN